MALYSKSSGEAKPTLVVAIIALVIAVIAVIVIGLLWQRDRAGLSKLRALKHMQTQAELQVIKSQLQQQQQAISGLQANQLQLQRLTNNTERQRALSQVAYLIHLANLHLNVGHEVGTSLKLLELASQRVHTLDDPALFTLRHALQKDIEALKASTGVDVSMLVLRLDALATEIQKLPLMPEKHRFLQQKPPSVEPIVPNKQAMTWYEKLMHNMKELIIIRHTHKSVMPLLSPQQQVFLKENVQAKILQAEWAVLHQQPKLYKESLGLVRQWLENYYHNETAIEKTISQLRALEAINIKPKLPDISNSLRAIDSSLWDATRVTEPSSTRKLKKKTKPQAKQKPAASQGREN